MAAKLLPTEIHPKITPPPDTYSANATADTPRPTVVTVNRAITAGGAGKARFPAASSRHVRQ